MRSAPFTLLVLAFVTATSCGDPGISGPDGGPDDGRGTNRAPVVAPVGSHEVFEGAELRINVAAHDPDGDVLTYRATPLPANADFDAEAGILRWTPPRGASAASPYEIEFVVADGEFESRSFGTIVVRSTPLAISDVYPTRVPQAGGTRLTVRGVGFTSPATVRLGGRLALDVTVNDDRSIQFTAPDMSQLFGPQLVSVLFEDGQSTSLTDGVFVYRDETNLRSALHRVELPEPPRGWAVADLEGDARGELLVGGEQGLWLVDAHGGDGARRLYSEPVDEVVAGNMTGDGREDAVFRTERGEVFVLRRGALDAPVRLHADPPALAVVTLDLEGDGDDEVVVLDELGGRTLYPAIGGTRFGTPIPSPDSVRVTGAEAADVDDDGVTDLLVTFDEGFGVAFGVETGAFQRTEVVTRDPAYRAPRFDPPRDTRPGRIAAVTDNTVVWFARANADDWRLVEVLELDPLPGRAALLDVDADPGLDLLRLETGFPGVRLDTLNAQELAFDDWWMVGPTEGEPGLADLSGDGLADLVLFGTGARSAVWVERRNADLRPAAPRGLFVGTGMGLQVADFNLDDRTDIVVTGTTIGQIPVHMMFRPQGRGLFGAEPVALPARERTDQVALGDFTGNRGTDVVSLDGDGGLRCFPALGRSTYGPSIVSRLDETPMALVGLPQRLGSLAAVLFESGDIGIVGADQQCQLSVVEHETPPDGAAAITAADLDGDGELDLLATTHRGSVVIYSASFGDNFTEKAILDLELAPATALGTGDVDGNGRIDLLTAGPDGVMVVFDAVDTGFGPRETALIDIAPGAQVTGADLNGDGLGEVIATGGGQPARIYWIDGPDDSEGDPSIGQEVLDDWTVDLMAPIVADIDRDGDLDIVTLDPAFGAIVWLNGAAP